MAKIDVRHDDVEEVTEIAFGDDETLVYSDNELMYIRSEAKLVPVFLDSIDNMIKALEQAKELWTNE